MDVLKIMTYTEIIWESLTKSRKFSALSAVRDSSQWKSNMKQIAMVHSRRLISTQSRSLHFLLLIFWRRFLPRMLLQVCQGPQLKGYLDHLNVNPIVLAPWCEQRIPAWFHSGHPRTLQSDLVASLLNRNRRVARRRSKQAPTTRSEVKNVYNFLWSH